MINLIPPGARHNVVHQYWIHVITVWLFLIGTLSLVCILLFMPTFILTRIQARSLQDEVITSSAKTSSYADSAAVLLVANQEARLLVDTATYPPFLTYVNRLEQVAGANVTINRLRLSRQKPIGTIKVSGVAETRQDLANFRDAVEADSYFITANLSISSLIKDNSLPFSMLVTFATSTTKQIVPSTP